ncbi:hypothetical protein [Actinomadura montaniterrae]|uniref:Uncharacterized protein n=1 Tax=Actinomadura montaniterrae TaxID=1803903 RepID=A0A6L3VWE4_9ACTN|nr:hypothetical protein [Actinomadura montaniterrae]KAB2379296.1 hypothetical protein F9B16_21025 [Actinomadura montaniterrae]
MTDYFDWQAALSDDQAHVFAHGAECALADAARDMDAMSPNDHALVGIGFALLAVRSQLAQTGGDVADQLSSIADDVRDLADAVVAVRRPWWARSWRWLSSRVARLVRGAERSSEEEPDEGLADVDAAAEPGVATVTPLRRTGVRP